MSRRCAQFNRLAQQYNPNAGGLALHYFSKNGECRDLYTNLQYWRRRFKSQDCYLSYFVPKQSYPRQFGTTRPYRTNGFSTGNVCPILYLGRGQACTKAQLGRVGKNGASCAAGRTNS